MGEGTFALGLIAMAAFLAALAVILALYLRSTRDQLLIKTHELLREQEQRSATSLDFIQRTLTGSHTRGAAGERVVEQTLRDLPAEWIERDVPVNGGRVEFALRLGNGLIVPLDSKWVAAGFLEKLETEDDPKARAELARTINNAVYSRVKEARAYIDPPRTTRFALAAVPDAAYELSARAQIRAAQENVIVISYGLLLPYLLLIRHTLESADAHLDAYLMGAHLKAAQDAVRHIESELNRRFTSSMNMLDATRGEIKRHLGIISVSLARLEHDDLTAPDNEQPRS